MAIPIPMVLVLDRALRDAGIPIDGVSVGDVNDRTTWRVFYTTMATAPQRTQGNQLLLSIDPQDAPTLTSVKAIMATARLNDEFLQAIVQGLWEAIPSPTLTLPQLRQRVKQIFQGLV
jgi:hypothetical protein